MKIDLHIHTTESDGCLTVDEVLETAMQRGLSHISITDHDTTLGVEKAINVCSKYGIDIIPGVEFNTLYKNEEIHVLGYYKSIENEQLQNRLRIIREERTEITQHMVRKLQHNGIHINWDEVRSVASANGVICKTHIMYALWKKTTEPNVIDWNHIASWFRHGGMAYIPYLGNPYQDAVDFILETGGLPVLAHPGTIKNQSLVHELLGYKVMGLEVYYGYWNDKEDLISYFKELSNKHTVLATGGSDYHGFYSAVEIGKIDVPNKCGKDLMRYLRIEPN